MNQNIFFSFEHQISCNIQSMFFWCAIWNDQEFQVSIWLATSFWNLKVSKQFGLAHFSNMKIWIWLICFEIKSTNSYLTWDFRLNFKLGYLSKNCIRHLFTYVISKGNYKNIDCCNIMMRIKKKALASSGFIIYS